MRLTLELERILAQFVRLERPLAGMLQPGLSRDAIDEMTADLPFKLPDEVYELYMWRNGTSDGTIAETEFFPGSAGFFAPLDVALADTLESLDFTRKHLLAFLDEEIDFTPADYYFVLFHDPGFSQYLIPCTTELVDKAPIIYWCYEAGSPCMHHRDLETMMRTIAACYESGAYYLNNSFENEPLGVEEDYAAAAQIFQDLNPDVREWQKEVEWPASLESVFASLPADEDEAEK